MEAMRVVRSRDDLDKQSVSPEWRILMWRWGHPGLASTAQGTVSLNNDVALDGGSDSPCSGYEEELLGDLLRGEFVGVCAPTPLPPG